MRRGNYPAAAASILPFSYRSKIFLELFDIIYLTIPPDGKKTAASLILL